MNRISSPSELSGNAEKIRESFEKGGIIIFPDSSVFVCGVLPFSKSAVERCSKTVLGISKTAYHSPAPYILVRNANIAMRFGFFSEQEKFIMSMLWRYPVVMMVRSGFHLPHKLIYSGKIGIKLSSSPLTDQILSICGGVMGSFPISNGGRPVKYIGDAMRFIEFFGDNDFFILAKPEYIGDVKGEEEGEENKKEISHEFRVDFPTYIELSENFGVRVIFEGAVQKKDISEMLGKFGFKVV